jgi:hypothetical protein
MTMTPEDVTRLERTLEDERERRVALENRLVVVTEQVRVWRERAEQKKVPIRIRVSRRLRSGATPQPTRASKQSDIVGDEPTAVAPVYPHIRIASLVTSRAATLVVAEGQVSEIVDHVVPPADLVVIELSTFMALPEASRRELRQALSEPGRPPMVLLSGERDDAPLSARVVESADDIVAFDPRTDPLALSVAPDGLDDAGRVRWRRYAYRQLAPERHLERWLDACGIPYRRHVPLVACLLVTMRPEELSGAVVRFDHQTWGHRSLVVGCHRFPDAEWSNAVSQYGSRPDVTLLRFGSEVTLGECLNRAAAASSGDVLAKWDDDDHYGPGYLEDAVNALRYSACGVVVKATQYVYIEARDVTMLRRPGVEDTDFSGDASGGTYVFRRRVWEDAPFPHRDRAEDIRFLASARSLGYEVYSNTRFDFAYLKRSSGSSWGVSDDLMVAQADMMWEGPPGSRVDAGDSGDNGTLDE